MAVWYIPNHGTEFSYIGTVFGQFRIELSWLVSEPFMGSTTAGKCMLHFVCYFPKAEISGPSPYFWPGITSLCGLFLVCYCWKLNNMLNVLKIC